MPKTFYTERDIEDMARQGTTSLVVDDNVVLTELAREQAEKLGVKLVREHDTPPSAPVRPYIAKPVKASPAAAKNPDKADLHKRVYEAALKRLGNEVDPKLLDVIVKRVLNTL